MKLRLGLLVAPILVLSACSNGTQTASGPVNIGVATALSAKYASTGSQLFYGAEAGAYVVNHNGGILGREVKAIGVDTAWDTIDAVPAIRKMLAVDNVSAEVGMGALDYTDSLPILNQAKMVSFNILGTPAVDKAVMPYSYSVKISDALEGAAMVTLAHSRGYHSLALVFDAAAGAQTFLGPIQFAAGKLGITIVATPTVPESAPSYQAEIQQVIQAKPDAVLMQLEPAQVGAFFNEWKTLGATNIPIIVTDFAVDSNWSNAAGADEVNNHMVGIQYLASISGPGGQDFRDAYQAVMNKSAAYFAVFGYDAVTLAALAMNAANSTDPTTYRPFIDDVTKVAPDHVNCDTYAACARLLKAGNKIKFIGVGNAFIFNQYHRVSGDFGEYKLPLGSNNIPILLSTIHAIDLTGLY